MGRPSDASKKAACATAQTGRRAVVEASLVTAVGQATGLSGPVIHQLAATVTNTIQGLHGSHMRVLNIAKQAMCHGKTYQEALQIANDLMRGISDIVAATVAASDAMVRRELLAFSTSTQFLAIGASPLKV